MKRVSGLAVRGRRLAGALVAGLVVALLATAIAIATAPRGVVLGPIGIEGTIETLSARTIAEQLRDGTLALRERARQLDELGAARPPSWLPIELDVEPGLVPTLARGLRRALRPDAVQISVDVVADGNGLELALGAGPDGLSTRARVERRPGAVRALVARGSEHLLLLTTPLAAATLAIAEARVQVDAAHLEELLAMLAREPAAAQDPRTWLVRGLYETAHGRCRDALASFDRVISARPTAPRAYVLAAYCHARLGERDRALARLATASKQAGDSPLALSLTGEAYGRVGEPARGLALLRTAYARDPAVPGAAIAIGEALLALHRPSEALAWLTNHPAADQRWLAACGMAQVRTGAGPAAEATVAALRVINPASAEAIRIEAELAAAMKAWPRALGRFGALRIDAPNDGAAYAGEGAALLGLRRYEDAVAAYRECAEVAPWLAACRLGLGVALREADQPEAALDALAEAASLDAFDPRVPLETARTLRALLRRDDAAAYAARADLLAQRLAQRIDLP